MDTKNHSGNAAIQCSDTNLTLQTRTRKLPNHNRTAFLPDENIPYIIFRLNISEQLQPFGPQADFGTAQDSSKWVWLVFL